MKLAIMQPYFLPYIGYFQLIAAVDVFVIYDNIKYTKKGWINRNRMLLNGQDAMFSLPLKSGSDALDVRDRTLAPDFHPQKLLNQWQGAYRRAPFFAESFSLLQEIMQFPDANLFRFLDHSVRKICAHLGLPAEFRISSTVPIDHALAAQDKVLALCAATGARTYVNAIGGLELYSREAFRARGIELQFLRSQPFEYAQFGQPFVPSLSILDCLMFNPPDVLRARVRQGYDLI
jgi:hypothetical protein